MAWGSLVGASFFELNRFDTTPGGRGQTSALWPARFPYQPKAEQLTLVLALHPQCPCSRATVRELSNLMARFPKRVAVYALVYEPAELPDGWHDNDLEQSLREIVGIDLVPDSDAHFARDFGCETSGHVLAYSADGRLVFGGGITRGRGQEGTSAGIEAVVDELLGHHSTVISTEVFGCPLCKEERK